MYIISFLIVELLEITLKSFLSNLERPCETPAATMAPEWIIGPSWNKTCAQELVTSQRETCVYDVMTWKRFPLKCPFVWGIPGSPVDSPRKGTVNHRALIFLLLIVWTSCRTNSRIGGVLRRSDAHLTSLEWYIDKPSKHNQFRI